MQSYNGDHALKAKVVERCEAHMAADRLRGKTYGKENGQFVGCAIGCHLYDIAHERGVDWRALNNDDVNRHQIVADAYNWPEWLTRLEDSIFEGLPLAARNAWPKRLSAAIPVGADIERVRHRLMVWMQREMLPRFFDAKKFPDVAAALARMATLHERATAGDQRTENEWSAAESAARSAARSAASAAWSAAESAASAASAARSAASAARSEAYQAISDKLVELLEAA